MTSPQQSVSTKGRAFPVPGHPVDLSDGALREGMPGAIPEFWPMGSFPERVAFSSENAQATMAALVRALDEAASHLEQGRWRQGMQLQHHSVGSAKKVLPAGAWTSFAIKDCLSHPVREFVHQDPFTRRSFQKPRGYAGDAVLIDYIYGIDHPEHELQDATPLGRWMFNYNTNAMAPRAVRRRMHLIAEYIDLVCAERPGARILSIASGHMRELGFSHALRAGVSGEIVAFDQDSSSLAEIEAAVAPNAVRCVQGSVSRLILGQHNFSDFDLVYASGLFDYLDQRAATRLTETMFDMLKPGGRMVIPNFLPDIFDIGYMESFMGWDLIFRDQAQILSLIEDIKSPIQSTRYFEETERNIGFLVVRKAP